MATIITMPSTLTVFTEAERNAVIRQVDQTTPGDDIIAFAGHIAEGGADLGVGAGSNAGPLALLLEMDGNIAVLIK